MRKKECVTHRQYGFLITWDSDSKNEAMRQCNTNEKCFGIQDVGCKGEEFLPCEYSVVYMPTPVGLPYPDDPIESWINTDEHSCVYRKIQRKNEYKFFNIIITDSN